TALAAGHRPCAECQRQRFTEFRAAWASGNPERAEDGEPTAEELDAHLHAERLTDEGAQRTFTANLDKVPDGAFVRLEAESEPLLVWGGELLTWGPWGYSARCSKPTSERVEVLTPVSTVRAIRAGFAPAIHESGETKSG
ncbi:MAG: hypothetical protein K2V38_27750, partial [Gemmataceae bacterium]|nr:hypothetical protein [Gemmataceae bacterium]